MYNRIIENFKLQGTFKHTVAYTFRSSKLIFYWNTVNVWLEVFESSGFRSKLGATETIASIDLQNENSNAAEGNGKELLLLQSISHNKSKTLLHIQSWCCCIAEHNLNRIDTNTQPGCSRTMQYWTDGKEANCSTVFQIQLLQNRLLQHSRLSPTLTPSLLTPIPAPSY